MIKIGDKLDLTLLQPTLSVKTTEKVIRNQEIQYDTEYVKDDNLRVGVIQPISEGKNGLKKVTIQVTKVNGMMTDEQVVNEEIIDQPVTAKARKGTKVVKGEGSGKFAWPVASPNITSTYGVRWGKLHKGIDITGNKKIMAADNGKVVETGYKNDYGNYVIINHLNGYETLYGHMSKIIAKEGAIVEKGEQIGVMGSTGDSTGVHLHFEIHKSGGLQNPLKYLNR
ncbi:peptidoglycan DD-metalloendopeptidase family protein [Paenibacillus hexagrammi]|uniref:Peptidoglycan DD-metalloendopeptidase family protein n=1 Tax=Paenibacillus hexagrammi TaxID=2908839 RepID=A0ABY3SJM3_9BACL|nr:peptidoglycan DD-metalloendopeptidase family protein [Paenibacillus sp. YPD9-1]UJF33340.1 peptidoglycan DD-metalloendopeptidase family protein [Paenibacillus sp. YPD9-1]